MEFYYNNLTKEQKKTYYAMKEGLLAMVPSFVVPAVSRKELSDIYFLIRLDNPQIFYTNTFKYRQWEGSDNVEIMPTYMFEKKKIMEHRQAMEARVKKLARQAEKLGEREKLLFIHDLICTSVTYDKLKKAYSHEIIGALGHGVAVCEGIAKAVKALCDALEIWCTIAISGANPEKGIKYRHAWNIVKIGKKYYHLDATFDNSVGNAEAIRYDYVCLGDKQIFRDHEPVIWKVPECTDGGASYYQEKKLSFTKMEDVAKRSLQAAKKGRVLTFHWRGGYLSKEVFDEIVSNLKESGAAREKHAVVSVNWPQAVFRVEYKENRVEDEVLMQEANEGELYDTEGENVVILKGGENYATY